MEQELNGSEAKTHLENLIPLAVVIAFGCEPCVGSAVRRALQAGTSKRDVQKVLAILRYMKTADCFTKRVGLEAALRMARPLAAATRILEETQPESNSPNATCCEPGISCH